MPSSLQDSQCKEILSEINNAVDFAKFPAGYGATVTRDRSFQEAIVDLMNSSNHSILALCGVLMVVALLLVFRHVRWPLLPVPVVLLGIIWTFRAMGFFHIPMSMVSFAAFPIMTGIGIDYAIQFHNLYLSEQKLPGKKKVEGHLTDGSGIGTFIAKVAYFCVNKSHIILGVALILALAGNYVDSQVPIETNTQNYIPQDLSPLIDLNHMKTIFGRTDSIQFIVQADDITDPKNLRWIDDFSNYLLRSRSDRTESVTSIATYIKQANGEELPDDKTKIREIIGSLPQATQDAYLSGHNLAVIDVNIGNVRVNLGTEGMARLIASYEDDLEWMTPPPGVRQTESRI